MALTEIRSEGLVGMSREVAILGRATLEKPGDVRVTRTLEVIRIYPRAGSTSTQIL
ncbi:hypothetical protein PPSIR1_00742 [Plesiocystis pacifica SIR-1]|uniref:Uncharacterized protein n=1 Tax=Plesiocystis pacifica SIR-1 TaxID=391625 RepID=A6GJR0_9BACT|nr:hypothetical protein PPSIR1_00742 [Plesiocystis pacifica SIR-1]